MAKKRRHGLYLRPQDNSNIPAIDMMYTMTTLTAEDRERQAAWQAFAYYCLDEWIVQALVLPLISQDVLQWKARVQKRGTIECGQVRAASPAVSHAHMEAVREWNEACIRDYELQNEQSLERDWHVGHGNQYFYGCETVSHGLFGVRPVLPGQVVHILGHEKVFDHIYYSWGTVFNPASDNPIRMTW